jgi:RNA polymerase sigma-70 factor, ECF subfamily
VNACYVELRQRRRWVAPFAAVAPEQAEPDTAVTVANRDELRRGFERISAEQRAAVVLHHYVGLTVPQIADALDTPPATVRSRLYYGMRGLRKAINADGRTSSVKGLA